MTPEERDNYIYYQKKVYSERDEYAAAESRGIEKGMAKGMAKGMEKRNIEIAKNLLKDNIPINIISKSTGLSEEQIKGLK